MYRVYFRSQALKAFESLQESAQRKVVAALEEIARGRWEGVDMKKVKGAQHGWRLRVGRWRVLYCERNTSCVSTRIYRHHTMKTH